MKTLFKITAVISLLAAAQTTSAIAAGKAGSVQTMQLQCLFNTPVRGVDYTVLVAWQAVEPQYSIRSVELQETAVVPNAKPVVVELSQLDQNASSANFESEDGSVQLQLDKTTMTATAQIKNIATTATCR